MDVLIWQIAILLGISLGSLLLGKTGWILASGAATLWTVAMVFTSWLMALQLVTVLIGWAIGAAIVASPNHAKNSSVAWTLILIGGVGIWWAISNNQTPAQDTSSSTVLPVPAKQAVNQPQIPNAQAVVTPLPAHVPNPVISPVTQGDASVKTENLPLSVDEKVSLDMACSSASMQGPSALNQCVQQQIAQLSHVQRANTNGLNIDEKVSLDMACSSASMSGPAALNQCAQQQIALLRQVERVSTDGLSIDEKVSLDMACSSASMQGPAALNRCVKSQLSSRRY